MNYVYDLLLNFKEEYYDFYDWNIKDVLDHIRRIPIFKVSTETMKDFLNYDLYLDKTFLDQIENEAEIFIGRRVKKMKYTFLITDSRKVLAIKVKENKLYLSDLLMDEEEAAMELIPILPFSEIKYEKIRYSPKQRLKTRKEVEFEKQLDRELKSLMKEENEEKLKYIYYECFDKKEDKRETILEDIQNELNINFYNFSKKLAHFLKITQRTI